MFTTRFTLVLVALVAVGTTATVAYWSRHEAERAIVPERLAQMQGHAERTAARIDSFVNRGAADARALAATPLVSAVVSHHVSLAGERSSAGPDRLQLDLLAQQFVAECSAKPWILQVRLVGARESGKEIVRVERTAGDHAVRIVPEEELRDVGTRPYVQAGKRIPRGGVHIAPLLPDPERGTLEPSASTVVRLAAPVFAADGADCQGVIVLCIDMRSILSATAPMYASGALLVVASTGEYVHDSGPPEAALGVAGSAGRSWKDDYPDVPDPASARVVRTSAGEQVGLVRQLTSLEPGIAVIESVPLSMLHHPVDSIYRISASVAGVSLVGSLVIAWLVLASLVFPLRRMAASVSRAAEPDWDPTGLPSRGELGVLTDALLHAIKTSRAQAAELGEQIEHHRKTEVQLEEQLSRERTYQAVIESSEDAIVTTTLNGVITSWNGGAERLYGFPAREAIGQHLGVLAPEDKVQEIAELLSRVNCGESIKQFETIRINKIGERFDVSLSASPVLSRDGTLAGIAQISHDISQRLAAEEQFRVVVESSPSGVCVANERGTIVLVNRAIEHLFGYSRDELLGQSVDMLLPMRSRGSHAALRDGYVRNPTERPMGAGRDLFGRRKDGTEIAVEIGLCPISIRGSASVLASVIDVTERRRSQQQLASYAARLEHSNAELEKFAYVVSHDMKAPLRGIASVAEWIAADLGAVVDSETKENLDLMLERTGRLSKLIDGILNYSRAGKVGAVPVPIVTKNLVRDVIASIPLPPGREVRVVEPIPDVRYDDTQLRQVFQNLIDNAIKHLGKPTGQVTVSGRETDDHYQFEVRDDGVGIPERHFSRIFELFQTLKPKDECRSAGAGLAIVKRIVESNGGSIRVASEEGVGTAFVFSIPKGPRETALAEDPVPHCHHA
ncbi:MAG: PAS domain S-box protein [Phycisphaerales bacterium]